MGSSSAPATLSRPAIESWRWGVVWLMFLATTLAYMDRQTVASTADYIVSDFQFGADKEYKFSLIDTCFGVTFGLLQIPAGWLADRTNIRWIYAIALFVWSLAGFATGLVHDFYLLLACRLLLGVGEAFNWPCAVGIVRRVIPLESRALANGIFHSGASIGAALTPLVAMALILPGGSNWRVLFLVVGGAGLLWCVLWLAIVRGDRAAAMSAQAPTDDGAAQPPEDEHVPLGRIFSLRTFWITLAVAVTVNICWHFYRIWLTRYLRKDLEFTQDDMQWILTGFFIAADLGSLLSGWMTRRLIYAGYSVERARKLVLLGAALLCIAAGPGVLAHNPWLALPLIFTTAAGSMAGFPIFFALAQSVSPRHTSLCLGIFGCLAWLCIAVLNPPIGALADRLGTFSPALIAVSCVPLVGAVALLYWPEPKKV